MSPFFSQGLSESLNLDPNPQDFISKRTQLIKRSAQPKGETFDRHCVNITLKNPVKKGERERERERERKARSVRVYMYACMYVCR